MSSVFENPDPAESTRERVLRAAGRIFAAQGFRDTTVREICEAARVNIASVNYHFRSKEALYGEVLEFAFREAQDRHPLTVAADPDAAPEERLRDFIVTFIRRLLDESDQSWQGRLIAREIMDPTAALDRIVESWIGPRFRLLREIVPGVLGRHCKERELDRYVLSIVGQCLVYRHSRSVIHRLCPEVIDDATATEETAAHVVRFCLAGLKHSGETESAGVEP